MTPEPAAKDKSRQGAVKHRSPPDGVIRSTFVLEEHGVVTATSYGVWAKRYIAKLRRDLGLDTA